MVIDVFLSMLKIFPPDTDNAVRFITGFSVGWFLPLLLHPLKNSLMFKPNTISCDVYLSGRKNFIAWVFAGIIFSSAFLLTYANRYILLVFSAVAVTGLIAFLAELLAILLFASAKKLKDSISSRLRYASYSAVSVLAACSFILASGSLKHLAEKI
jgi:hypothetical protein